MKRGISLFLLCLLLLLILSTGCSGVKPFNIDVDYDPPHSNLATGKSDRR